MDSQQCPISTDSWGIPSVFEGTLVSQCLRHFLRGFRGFWKIFQPLLRNLDCISRLISLGVSSLVAGSSTVWPLIPWRFWGLLIVLQLHVMKGAPTLSGGLLSSILGNMLPAFFFNCLVTEEDFMGCLPFLWWYFGGSRLSSCSVRRIEKNRGNRKMFSNVLWV